MTRLTNEMRNGIIRRLVAQRFSSDREELKKQKNILGQEVYKDLYSPGLRASMEALPKGFLDLRSRISCQFGSDITDVLFGCEKLLASKHCGYVVKIYESTDPRSTEFYKLKDIETELDNKEAQARETARSILYSVHTVEKLLQAWPECKPFVVMETSIPKPLLPALPIDEVNAMLGLTPISEQQEGVQA